MFALVKTSASMGHEIELTAIRTGLTTDQFQKLRYAGLQFGVDADRMTASLGILAVKLQKAKDGAKEAVALFKKVNIDPKQMKDTNELLMTIADRFHAMGDSSEAAGKKLALARMLLGRGGAGLLPLLDSGSEAVRKLGMDLVNMGGVLDKTTIKAGTEFEAALKSSTYIVEVFKTKIGAALLPQMTKMLQSFLDWMKITGNQKKINDGLTKAVDVLVKALEGIVKFAKILWSVFNDLSDAIGGVDNALETMLGLWAAWNLIKILAGIKNVVLGIYGMATALWASSVPMMFVNGLLILMNGLIAVLTAPITLVIAGTILLTAALVSLYNIWHHHSIAIKKFLTENILNILYKIREAWNDIKSFFGFGGGGKNIVVSGGAIASGAPHSRGFGGIGMTQTNQLRMNQNLTINVGATTNAEELGKNVQKLTAEAIRVAHGEQNRIAKQQIGKNVL